MTEFAVRHKEDPPEKGYWVFAVDSVGERLLVANTDSSLRWIDIKDCVLIKAANPEMARPVIVATPQVVQAERNMFINRHDRRNH